MVEDNEAPDASGEPPAPPPPSWPIVGKSSRYYDKSRRFRRAQRLATADPTNTDWQRDLSVSHTKLGDLARAAGDLTAAGEHYTAALTIRERLATADPTNTDWQRNLSEFLDSLRFDPKAAEVFVFTPKGDVVSLPLGASPVDFAYAVHTEVGHRCIGARVNGRLVPLESSLDNGDVVEIFTSKAPNAGPSRDWLTYVKSGRARRKIRHWFAKDSLSH